MKLATGHFVPRARDIGTLVPLLLIGCLERDDSRAILEVAAAQEFTFNGGQLRDGKIYVDPGTEVEKGADGKKVFLKRQDGGGLEIDCSCILEREDAFCFAVVDTTPGGPVIINCGDANCGETVQLCVYDITETDGFRLRVASFLARG